MNKSTWNNQDHSEFYPQENQPKYQIGDRIPDTNIYVRGLMTTSDGKHIYFWQVGDNSLVIREDDIDENILAIAANLTPVRSATGDHKKSTLTQEQYAILWFYTMSVIYSEYSDIPMSMVSLTAGNTIASISPEGRQAMVNDSLDMLSKLYVAHQLTNKI